MLAEYMDVEVKDEKEVVALFQHCFITHGKIPFHNIGAIRKECLHDSELMKKIKGLSKGVAE